MADPALRCSHLTIPHTATSREDHEQARQSTVGIGSEIRFIMMRYLRKAEMILLL